MADLKSMTRRELVSIGRNLCVPRAARLNKSVLVARLSALGAPVVPRYYADADAVKEEIFGRWRLPPSYYDNTDYVQFRGPCDLDEVLKIERLE